MKLYFQEKGVERYEKHDKLHPNHRGKEVKNVNKRLVIKTALICTGVFVILISIAIFAFNTKYELDTEKHINVIVASKDILPGEIIKETMVEYRTIKESAVSPHMLTDPDQLINAKTTVPVKSGDYIFSYNLLPPGSWQSSDARTIVLPMAIDERLANLIKKGSVINIKVLPADVKTIPKLVLSHITVSDVLDENGLSLGDTIGSKKAYAVVTLKKEQRDRLYAAMQYGKLMYELYCDSTQPPDVEDFVIPPEFSKNPLSGKDTMLENQNNNKPDGGAN
ncbi:MAG: hypothetical protein FIA99_01805 [Ruminiclostridium sp.]|nr:hypothetical protein [Ruminiclostridium sp.]